MKKFLRVIIIVALAVVMTISLVGCRRNNRGGNNNRGVNPLSEACC